MQQDLQEFKKVFIGDLVTLNKRVYWGPGTSTKEVVGMTSKYDTSKFEESLTSQRSISLRRGSIINEEYTEYVNSEYDYKIESKLYLVIAISFLRKTIIHLSKEDKKQYKADFNERVEDPIIENEWYRKIVDYSDDTRLIDLFINEYHPKRTSGILDLFVQDTLLTRSAQQKFFDTEILKTIYDAYGGALIDEVIYELVPVASPNSRYLLDCYYSDTLGPHFASVLSSNIAPGG